MGHQPSSFDRDYASKRLAIRHVIQCSPAAGFPAVDHYDLDDGDASHPIFIDYVPPATATVIGKATLSWKMRQFRSTANLNPSSVGAGSAHAHEMFAIGSALGDVTSFESYSDGGGVTVGFGAAGAFPGQLNSFNESAHTHSLTGTSSQAVTDGATTTVTNVLIDGVDQTAALGGPWSGDVVEMDITSVFSTTTGRWHTIQLNLAGLGRVVSMLRLYYS